MYFSKAFFDNLSKAHGKFWPPYLNDYDHKLLIWSEFSQVEKYMINNFGRESNIAKLFYDYFITGYSDYTTRRGFGIMSNLFKKHLNA